MNRRARWLVTLFVVATVMAVSVLPGLAAEQGEIELRRLALENRVAELIANLNLTPDQKDQLKQVAESYRAAQSAITAELAEVLAKRRDALLANDREALNEVNEALRALANRRPLASDENVAEFISGLTERQRQVLTQILPGIGRQEPRVHQRVMPNAPETRWQVRRLDRRPAPVLQRRPAPISGLLFVAPGHDVGVVDILIDLLEK